MSQVEGGRAELWLRTKEIVADAIALPNAARQNFVDAQCGQDAALRHEVMQTLKYASGSTGFIEQAAQLPEEAVQAPLEALVQASMVQASMVGERVGAYVIDGELGRGGMGVVYSAQRADGAYQQRVAIKVLLTSNIGLADTRRFARERELLAQLDHPNIARLLDGGTTESGLPYLVMEAIDGVQIDAFARAKKLSVPARVTLVRGVCAAVQSAHQKLLIHRDIKPANILVTSNGQPKLLDFGIARLLEEASSATTGSAIGSATLDANMLTPRYASPEQVRGEAVSVATDVYALGLLLYELLGGASPYERIASAKVSSAAAALQVVLEDAPRKLSEVAKINAPEHAEKLVGDLDIIALKACAKLPAERYATVAALDEDLRRYLDEEPILARPPALLYRFRKLISRNRLTSAATALAVVAVVAGGASTIIQKRKTEARYAQVRELANSLIFKYYDKIESMAGSAPVRESLAKDGIAFLDSLADDTAGDTALGIEIAGGYLRVSDVLFNGRNLPHLGKKPEALATAEKARVILENILQRDAGQPAANLAMAIYETRMGSLLTQEGKSTDAIKRMENAAARYEALLKSDPKNSEAAYKSTQNYLATAQAAMTANLPATDYIERGASAYKRWAEGERDVLDALNLRMFLVRTQLRQATMAKDDAAVLKFTDEEIVAYKTILDDKVNRENYVVRGHLRSAYATRGVSFIALNQVDNAVSTLSQARQIGEEIVDKNVDDVDSKIGLARIYTHAGRAELLRNSEAGNVAAASFLQKVLRDLQPLALRQYRPMSIAIAVKRCGTDSP